eukprot:365269-Chlamydomonas_euryale.AAC.1
MALIASGPSHCHAGSGMYDLPWGRTRQWQRRTRQKRKQHVDEWCDLCDAHTLYTCCGTQETFDLRLQEAGRPVEPSELFDFWRPKQRAGQKSSQHLTAMSELQHNVVYALSGCSDVTYCISNILQTTRTTLHEIYQITQDQLSVWYKNRGRTPSVE